MEECSILRPSLLKRFCEVLVLLRVLGQVQGGRIKKLVPEDGTFHDIGAIEMRRKVMYHLFIMCDFEKGGSTVTAMATGNLPSGPKYWVAANDCLEKIRSSDCEGCSYC